MFGRERRDVLRDLLHHLGIGLRRDVLAAEMLGQRNDAERNRHPRLDARYRILLRRIALDPNQFGRAAADVEQDGAAPLGSSSGEQPVTARAASVSRSITSSRMPVSAATRCMKSVGIRRRAAGLGRDQPQPLGLPGMDLVAANAQRGNGAVDRGLADAAGRRDALAEPDDPRERIDHAKAVAGRTGDQQAAIVGAEVQRSVDAGCRRRRLTRCGRRRSATAAGSSAPRRFAAALGHRLRAAQGPREAACLRSSKVSFRGPLGPTWNFRSRKL